MECIGGFVSKLEEKQTKNGKTYWTFSVAENKGFGENKQTTWHNCSTWNQPSFSDKTRVIVFGHTSTREVGDKTYTSFEVFQVLAETPSGKSFGEVPF